jgi:hypothetical protein
MIDGILPPKRPVKTVPTKINNPTAPVFKPPEQVAREDQDFAVTLPPAPPEDTAPTNKRRFAIHLTKKQWIIVGVISVLLLGGIGAVAYKLTHQKKPAPAPIVKATPTPPPEPPKPTTVPSPLTGVPVAPELAKLTVTGVMIENSPDARPQSGLRDAGIVYEAIAEGGITRFMALFQETQPDYVGPVRSARPYYLDWLQGYDAAIAHVGGSPEALALIKSAGIKDLDQFYNSGVYQRVKTRYAPHNVYTGLPQLKALEKTKGFAASTFTGFSRKAETPMAAPTARSIDLTMSGYLYNVHYDYDAATNSYKRSEGGKPHMDERSKAQLNPKVVVAIVVRYGIKSDGLHSDYATTGNGKAYVFQDGGAAEVTWEKKSAKDPLQLKAADGTAVALNPGQTWVTAIKTANQAAYKP